MNLSDESSGEKKHPASDRKLRKQREKGNVIQSRESLLAVVTVVGLTYLFFSVKRGREIGILFFELDHHTNNHEFTYKVKSQLILLGELIALFAFPMMLIVSVLTIAVGVLMSGGFVFTTEKMKPDFTKFNPAKGLKNIFSLKSLKSFVMNMLRILAVGTVVGFIIYYFLPSILASSNCGFDCGVSVNATVYFYVLAVLIIASIAFAVLDYIVQRSEFLRQNKMTETEKKQERKEQYGSPEIKSRLREIRQEIATKTIGLHYASFIVADSLNRAIAIRYVRGGDQPPIIVAKARGRDAVSRMISRSGKPAEHVPELLPLISKIEVGDPIVDEVAIRLLVPFLQKYT